jgi:hypothetical protein
VAGQCEAASLAGALQARQEFDAYLAQCPYPRRRGVAIVSMMLLSLPRVPGFFVRQIELHVSDGSSEALNDPWPAPRLSRLAVVTTI